MTTLHVHDDREGRTLAVRLTLMAVVALLIHALLLPVPTWWPLGRAQRDADYHVDAPQAPAPEEPMFGQVESRVSSVAWISHDDFRELLARQSSTEQPALQQKEDPVPEAPAELDPTPPAPTAEPAEIMPPALTPPMPPDPTMAAAPPAADLPLPSPDSEAVGELPRVEPSPAPPATAPAETASAATQSAPPTEAKPTSSARSDRESPPTSLLSDAVVVQPGRVIAREGLEIKTVAPRFSAITLASILPRNPRALLTFDGSGQVIEVELLRSSGAGNVDGPVVASLYKWRASGRRIEELGDGTLKAPVTLLLVRE